MFPCLLFFEFWSGPTPVDIVHGEKSGEISHETMGILCKLDR